MKKYLPFILIGFVLLLGANYDNRNLQKPIARYELAQQTWASGATAAASATIAKLNGQIVMIEVDVDENTTNNITFTLAIATPNSGSLYSQASIADNGATIYRPSNAIYAANDTLTFTLTPSGDPGATGATVDVRIWMK